MTLARTNDLSRLDADSVELSDWLTRRSFG